ncbi:MAG: hypothetical protein H6832_02180 [Planctomycetes bacterium]|nr:hypothetical protein [Planctomycetota bacterium]
MSKLFLRTLGLAVLAAVVPLRETRAAEQARSEFRGRCQLGDGTPWAGAKVVLISNVWGRVETDAQLPSDVDEVRVTSDERGVYRAELLPGRLYSAWAVDETRRLSSAVLEDVCAGLRSRDALVGQPDARETVCRVVVPARLASDVLTFRCVPLIRNFRSIDLSYEDGRLHLPILPRCRCRVECESREGFLIGMIEWKPDALAKGQGEESMTWTIDPGTEVRVRIVDVAGKPISGATVHAQFVQRGIGERRECAIDLRQQERKVWPVAKSDKDGTALFHVPTTSMTCVTARGFAPTFIAFSHDPSDGPLPDVVMPRVEAKKLRVCLGQRDIEEARFVRLEYPNLRIQQRDLTAFMNSPLQTSVVRATAEGEYVFDELETGAHALILDPKTRAMVDAHYDIDTLALGIHHIDIDVSATVADSAKLDLAGLNPRELRVLTASASPVAGAFVATLEAGATGHRPYLAHYSDRRGQVHMLTTATPDTTFHAIATLEEQGWSHLAEASSGSDLKLRAFQDLEIVVQDASGDAVGDIPCFVTTETWTGMNSFFRLASMWNARAMTGTTDASGILRARLIPWQGQTFIVAAGHDSVRGQATLTMDDVLARNEPMHRLVVELGEKKQKR